MPNLVRLVRYVWAFPATALGLTLVLGACLTGGSAAIVQGAIEAQGGMVCMLLQRRFLGLGPIAAMTLGHVILGRDADCLDRTRRHERVHVRQYERWGPLFLPLYLAAGAILCMRGLDPYLDNPFEREAFEQTG